MKTNSSSSSIEPRFRGMPSRLLARLAAVAATLGLTAGAALMSAAPSQALTSCTLGQSSKFAQVVCTRPGGHTQVRAAIGCYPIGAPWAWYARTGPWVGINQTSQAACRWYENVKVLNGRPVAYYEGR